MSLAEKQRKLIAQYRIIEDRQERMAAIVSRGKRWPEVPLVERTETNRVAGCVSRVWLRGTTENQRCHFQMSADSPLVKGLAALICELLDGEEAVEISLFEPTLLEELGLAQTLSPTRLNGLASVERTIREFSKTQLKRGS